LSFKFKVAPRADRQIRFAADWWVKNRTSAPNMFAEELEGAFTLIEQFPHAGEAISHPGIPNLRRVLLSGSQYHLYYSVLIENGIVEVLALWHTSRGFGPRL